MASDRILGLVIVCTALAFIASAFQIQTSFLSDPVGPKSFPILVGGVAALCGFVMILRPDPDPEWPVLGTFFTLAVAVVVLVGYAYALKPLGFIVPTIVVTSILSYQLSPRVVPAIITGFGLSIGLFLVFRFALGLSLFAFPKDWFG